VNQHETTHVGSVTVTIVHSKRTSSIVNGNGIRISLINIVLVLGEQPVQQGSFTREVSSRVLLDLCGTLIGIRKSNIRIFYFFYYVLSLSLISRIVWLVDKNGYGISQSTARADSNLTVKGCKTLTKPVAF
jgi:hypothetical protein